MLITSHIGDILQLLKHVTVTPHRREGKLVSVFVVIFYVSLEPGTGPVCFFMDWRFPSIRQVDLDLNQNPWLGPPLISHRGLLQKSVFTFIGQRTLRAGSRDQPLPPPPEKMARYD